jgi:EAL domain-containing protein (putative c-di-GMP-specific phosphodiesterase class I)
MNTKNLNLEVTETTSMADIKTTLKVLNELREMGISISIDDFGTGYSSLAYLKQFPITTLKIDRSFVTDIEINKDGEAVIKTIIALAKILELNVIAEGVETQEQLNFLGVLGCDKIQGYLIAKPLTPTEFSTAIKTGELAYGKQQYSIAGDESGYFTPSSNGNIR